MFKATPIQYNASLVNKDTIILDHTTKDRPILLDVPRYISTLVNHANKDHVAKIMNELVIFVVANGALMYTENLLQYCLRHIEYEPLETALTHGLDLSYKNLERVISDDIPAINFFANTMLGMDQLTLLLKHGANPNGEEGFEHPLLACCASEQACHILFNYGATLPSSKEIDQINLGSEKIIFVYEHHRKWIANKVDTSILPKITKTKLRHM